MEHTPIFPINTAPPEYAYVSALRSSFPDMADLAESNLMAAKNLVGLTMTKQGNTGVALSQLEGIIQVARQAEIKFLLSHGFSSGGDNWSELIKGINYVLGSEAVFERAINLLEQYVDPDNKDPKKEFKAVNKYLMKYIQQAVYDAVEKASPNADLGELAQSALEAALLRLKNINEAKVDGKVQTRNPKEGEQSLQAFQELYNFTQVAKNNPFFRSLKDLFRLEEYIVQVQQQIKQVGKVQSKDRLPLNPVGGGKKYHGTLAEILDATITREGKSLACGNESITWRLIGTQVGGKNYKPDVILVDEQIQYDYNAAAEQAEKELSGGTVRQKGIRTMEILFQQLRDAKGSMVIMSDKNYLINQMFDNGSGQRMPGFNAQSPTSLNSLEALLSTVGMGGASSLIDYFANAGDSMLLDLDEDMLRVIASRVANFLFDDISITPPTGLNVIHVFNLSGVYVPLSFVLQGVAAGLREVQNKMMDTAYVDSFVNVNFKQGPVDPPAWSSDAWVKFRRDRQSKTFIEVHFLQGFADEIVKAVRI